MIWHYVFDPTFSHFSPLPAPLPPSPLLPGPAWGVWTSRDLCASPTKVMVADQGAGPGVGRAGSRPCGFLWERLQLGPAVPPCRFSAELSLSAAQRADDRKRRPRRAGALLGLSSQCGSSRPLPPHTVFRGVFQGNPRQLCPLSEDEMYSQLAAGHQSLVVRPWIQIPGIFFLLNPNRALGVSC